MIAASCARGALRAAIGWDSQRKVSFFVSFVTFCKPFRSCSGTERLRHQPSVSFSIPERELLRGISYVLRRPKKRRIAIAYPV